MKKYFNIFVSLLFGAVTFAQSPTVSNVLFSQRIDGSHIVDVYYDVNNSGGGAMSVAMEVSDDNGVTWNFPCVQVTGDVGGGVTSGTNKHIVWNFASEHPNKFEDQMRIKITAVSAGAGVPCPGIPTVTYAGKTYNTVLIGSQCWLKENLDVGLMIQGSQNATNNGVIEKYCYNNNTNNCNTYGGLYQWNEAMQYSTTQGTQGICPTGWHIPTLAEFQTLRTTVNNDGKALLAYGQGSGTNTSGFSALLGGGRGYNGYFYQLYTLALFWSSTEYSAEKSFNLYLSSMGGIDNYDESKDNGFSIRCIKE